MKNKLTARINRLEKRIAALELQLKDGKQAANEIVSTWESTLLEFADTFCLKAPGLRARQDGSSKMEEEI